MIHNIHLFLGDAFSELATNEKKYVASFGGKASSFFQVINWKKDDDGELWDAVRIGDSHDDIMSISSFKGVNLEFKKDTMLSEELYKKYFADLFSKTVTIQNPGEINILNISLIIPVYREVEWDECKRIIDGIKNSGYTYNINIIGYFADLAFLFCSEEKLDELKESYSKNIEIQKKIVAEIVEYKNATKKINRLVLLQNRNSNGLSFNFDFDTFTKVMGEYALLETEKYYTIFPAADIETDVAAVGLSMLTLDKFYFITYLLRRACLNIMDNEKINQESVSYPKVFEIAKKCLAKHKNFFEEFYEENVAPLKIAGKDNSSIVVAAGATIDGLFSEIEKDFLEYFNDSSLSLPEKECVLATILAQDDSLLMESGLYSEKMVSIDDSINEAVETFIVANNMCVSTAIDEDDKMVSIPATIKSPVDMYECAYNPLESIYRLKKVILESTNYIKKKEKELQSLSKIDISAEQTNYIITKGNRVSIGGVEYNLINDVKETPLEDKYIPSSTLKILDNVDLRNNFTEVKSQGKIGSCTTFAVTSIYEYILKKSGFPNPDLSERFVFYNNNVVKNKIEEGSSFYDVINNIAVQGICLEVLCPYREELIREAPTEEAKKDALDHLIVQAKQIELSTDLNKYTRLESNHKIITSALSEGYPVGIGLKVYSSFANTNKGFVFCPTPEEIASEEDGCHAMVVCGYSETDKVYIVRNSWSTSFGDNGYCYVPFSYIDDSDFNHYSCIITQINEGKETKGIVNPIKVEFNKTDSVIQQNIIRILLEEEKSKLDLLKEEYQEKSFDYNHLIEQLSVPSNRNEILANSCSILQKRYEEKLDEHEKYISQIPQTMKEFRIDRNKNLFFGGIAALVFAIFSVLAFIYDFYEETKWMFLLPAITAFAILFLILYFIKSRHDEKLLHEDLMATAAGINSAATRILKEKEEKELKLHIAGMILDHFTSLKANLIIKLNNTVSFVQNMKAWYEEEKIKLEIMEDKCSEPLLSLFKNEILDEYFEREGTIDKKESLMSQYLMDNIITNINPLEYRESFKKKAVTSLNKIISSFKMYEYICNANNDFSYLDKSSNTISDLLPKMNMLSDLMLYFGVVNKDSYNSNCKFILMNVPEDKIAQWQNEYIKYFSMAPTFLNISDTNKIIVFSKQNIMLEDIKQG